jgi:ribosomal protein S6
MYNIYEIIFIIEPTVSINNLNIHIDNFVDMIKKKNGINLAVNIVQQKKLAWVCKKYKYGYLIYHKYVSQTDVVSEYEKDLKSLEICILWQTILVQKNIQVDKYNELDATNKYNIISESEEYNVMKDII